MLMLFFRLVSDGSDQVQIYHTLENARWYHGKTPQFVELPVVVSSNSKPPCKLGDCVGTYSGYILLADP